MISFEEKFYKRFGYNNPDPEAFEAALLYSKMALYSKDEFITVDGRLYFPGVLEVERFAYAIMSLMDEHPNFIGLDSKFKNSEKVWMALNLMYPHYIDHFAIYWYGITVTETKRDENGKAYPLVSKLDTDKSKYKTYKRLLPLQEAIVGDLFKKWYSYREMWFLGYHCIKGVPFPVVNAKSRFINVTSYSYNEETEKYDADLRYAPVATDTGIKHYFKDVSFTTVGYTPVLTNINTLDIKGLINDAMELSNDYDRIEINSLDYVKTVKKTVKDKFNIGQTLDVNQYTFNVNGNIMVYITHRPYYIYAFDDYFDGMYLVNGFEVTMITTFENREIKVETINMIALIYMIDRETNSGTAVFVPIGKICKGVEDDGE